MLLFLLVSLVGLASCQDCPAVDSACTCQTRTPIDPTIVMYCDNMGFRATMPAFKTNPINVDEFVVRNSSVEHVPQSAFENTGIRILRLQSIGLQTLDPNAFLGQIGNVIEQIHLQNNSLRTIPKQIFLGLRKLVYIDLSRNMLAPATAVMYDLLVGLTNLLHLRLNDNAISMFPAEMFRDNSELQTLYVQRNLIPAVTAAHLVTLVSLTKLDLSHNKITDLPFDTFSRQEYLEYLNISDNKIMTLPNGLLSRQTRLIHFNASGNLLTSIPGNMFSSSLAMQTVDLSRNQLRAVEGSGLFDRLREMRIVALHNNMINLFAFNDFRDMVSLVELDVRNNQLQSLPDGLLLNNDQLKTLRLGGNRLTGLRRQVFKDSASTVYEMDLSNNNLILSEVVLNSLGYLHVLNLSGNRLETIDRERFSAQEQLQHLDLSNNSLTLMNPEYFYYTVELRTLNASFNSIQDILDRAFARNGKLETLVMTGNRLISLRADMFSGAALKVLYLDQNNITSIPNNVFARISLLEELYLNGNRLTTLEQEAFTPLSTLKKLVLDNNMISAVPEGVFFPVKNLVYLSMTGNGLTTVSDKSFSDLKNLDTLDLSYNSLRSLKQSVVTPMRKLVALMVGNNPFACSCEIMWMRGSTLIQGYNQTVCYDTSKQKWYFVMCNPATDCDPNITYLVEETDELCYSDVPVLSTLTPGATTPSPNPNAGKKETGGGLDPSTTNTLIIVGVILAIVVLAAIVAILVMSQRNKKRNSNVLVTNGGGRTTGTMASHRSNVLHHPEEHVNAGATLDTYKLPQGTKGATSNSLQWRQSQATGGLGDIRSADNQLHASEEHQWSYETTAEQL